MIRLRDILAAAAHNVGYVSSDAENTWEQAADAVGLPAASRYIVVLIDGMGLTQLEARRGHIPFLRRRHLQSVRTTVPSTTACAITSFATGYDPGRTGMIGFTARDPESGSRIQLLSFADSPVTPEVWQSEPTIAQRADHRGTMCSVGPEKFRDSGLTLAAWRGMREVYAETFEERVQAALAQLNGGARLVYLYWADLDHAGHVHGWESEEWTAQLEHVDAQLSALARALPRDTGLAITADHGMVDILQRRDFAASPHASQCVTAGEERMLQVFVDEPDRVDEIAQRTAAWLGDCAHVWSRDDMLAALGGASARVAPRVGDFAIVAEGSWGISDSRWMSENQMRLVGAHGATSEAEMTVPLAVELS